MFGNVHIALECTQELSDSKKLSFGYWEGKRGLGRLRECNCLQSLRSGGAPGQNRGPLERIDAGRIAIAHNGSMEGE